MPGVTLDSDWSYRDLQVLRLENDLLQADFFPMLGAKCWRLLHKPSGEQLLWHHPRLEPRSVQIGASYDDNFCGGWDELFPNDAPGEFEGTPYPDHGELWSQPWDWRVVSDGGEEVSVRFTLGSVCTPSIVEKTVTLRAGESKLRFAHSIRNVGAAPFHFLWKLHPALCISGSHVLDVPARRAVIVHPEWTRCPPSMTEFPWPTARLPGGGKIDFRQVPPAGSGTRDFLYLVDLTDGWCALTDTDGGIGFGLAFPKSVFTSVWVFLTNGGWRGLDCIVLEPCTAWPKNLDDALARSQIARLAPGSTLKAAVIATVFKSRTGVATITPEGDVTAR